MASEVLQNSTERFGEDRHGCGQVVRVVCVSQVFPAFCLSSHSFFFHFSPFQSLKNNEVADN